jgi:hypothetical protein
MPATLKMTHKAIGAEVRRGTYDVVVDGKRAGSVEMNHTVIPGRARRSCPAQRAAVTPSPPSRLSGSMRAWLSMPLAGVLGAAGLLSPTLISASN